MASREYTTQEKWAIVAEYNLRVDPVTKRVKDGGIKELTSNMGVPKQTIFNFVNEYKQQKEELLQEYDYDTLERIWAHQLDCYREILRLEGGNNYPNPHGGSIVRQKAGRTVANMFVERALVDHCQEVCDNYF